MSSAPDVWDLPVTAVTDVTDAPDRARLDGEALCDDLHRYVSRFCAFPSPECVDAVVAWVLHTWALDCFDTTPRLALLSPEPGSGKTRVLEVVEQLVPNPKQVFNVTSTVLFRSMVLVDDRGDTLRPTVLLDECDTIWGSRKADDNQDLRGFVNAGYRRGAMVERGAIRGKEVIIESFPAFAAIALAGLDDLPDTVMSRSVVIRMRRRAPHEVVQPYRLRLVKAEAMVLADRCKRWTQTVTDELASFVDDLPDGITDRAADVWEPLILVGDAAGPRWSERVRSASLALSGQSRAIAESLGIRLLADLRAVFAGRPHVSTSDLLDALNVLDESPWGDLRGKPLDARGLSRRLSRYGVKPRTVRIGDTVAKGYAAEDLHDPWTRYLPPHARDGASVTRVTAVADPLDLDQDAS